MSITDQFSLALKVFREIESELGQGTREAPPPPSPSLDQLTHDLGPLPEGSLLLGVAADGLPLLLGLYDPAPGPVLVTGDKRSGKTAFLQTLARATDLTPEPGEIQFGVLTNYPGEWTAIETLPGSMGIWPAAHGSAGRYLNRLVAWGGHPGNDGRTAVLLLIDGLDTLILSESVTRQDLMWLLSYGPEHRIWPVATINAARLPRFASWLQFFGLSIFGYVSQPDLAEGLTGDSAADLHGLIPGVQFSLRNPDGWLKFWIPSTSQERNNK
jgi:hypothetical protein